MKFSGNANNGKMNRRLDFNGDPYKTGSWNLAKEFLSLHLLAILEVMCCGIY